MDYSFETLPVPMDEEGRMKRLRSDGLKKLNDRHVIVVLLYLEGIPPRDISTITKYNQQYVNWIIRQPVSRALMKEKYLEMDEEFKALYSKSIEAIRDGLDSNDLDTRLKAADKYLKAHGKYGTEPGEGPATAEDVIKRILEIKMTEVRPVK